MRKWMRRSWLVFLLAQLAALAAAAAERRPNILLIVADDLGWADVGCYGQREWATPHLDRLARDGLRFTQGYSASPVCSPTRAALLTGVNPATLGITDWQPGEKAKGWFKNPPLLTPDNVQQLPAAEVTLPELLRAAGYATALVGKWHVGEGPGHQPGDHGFEHVFKVTDTNPDNQLDYFSYDDEGQPNGRKDNPFLEDLLSARAIAWLRAPRDRPFFLYYATHAVHTPVQAPAAEIARQLAANRPASGPDAANYAAMTENLDAQVGRVLRALDEAGRRDATIVVFISDNGGRRPQTSNGPLRGGKASLYEGGVRVPFIARWPGVVAAGATSDAVVSSTDLFPTLLAAAGLPIVSSPRHDGRDLGPLLRGGDAPARDALFFHYPHYIYNGEPVSAVRAGDWKLIHFYADGRDELYHLATDPSEKNDLRAAEPGRAAELRARLVRWLTASGARLPVRNPRHDPARPSGIDLPPVK